jgi:phosphatidylglycerophosphate synthase
MNIMAYVVSSLRTIRGGRSRPRGHLTEFLAAEKQDYPVLNERYIAFEKAAVSILRKQDIVEPNHITYFRFMVSLILLLFFLRLSYLQILIMATLGGLSDFIDGAFARSASKKTRLGVLIDPLADKVLIFTIMYVLFMKKVLDPIYVIFMVIMESHIVIVPVLSLIYGVFESKNTDLKIKKKESDSIYIGSRPVFFGRVKVHLYIYALFSLLMGKAFDVLLLVLVAHWCLMFGICAAGIAFGTYIIRWFRQPYFIL